MKADRFGYRPLAGPRTVAVLFDKPSTRTRVSFAVGIAELGGQPLVIDAQTAQLGRGEPVADTARVLDRQVAAIVWRTFGQDRIEEMASVSRVPVINALTDRFHPCQVLADLQTARAAHGRLAGVVLTFLGDGASNMAHSYLLGGATAGMRVRIAAPAEYRPDPGRAGRRRRHRRGHRRVGRGDRRREGGLRGRRRAGHRRVDVDGAGRPGEERVAALRPYQLDEDKLALGRPDCVVLHCLPAHRGEEITAAVLDGPRSRVWDEAENRLHAQKALLAWLLERAR